jgi:hypothetical protein
MQIPKTTVNSSKAGGSPVKETAALAVVLRLQPAGASIQLHQQTRV